MSNRVRSAALTGYGEVARGAGLVPSRMLRAAGLDPACLTDPDIRLSSEAVGRLLEASAEASGIEDFGLRLAARHDLANLGPIGLIAREEPTVRRALEAMDHYMRLHNEALSVRIVENGGMAVVRIGLVTGRAGAARQSAELSVGVLYRTLKLFLGQRWEPELVCFTHGAPMRMSSHRRFFGAPIEFGHSFDGIVCKARDLDAPIATSDPAMVRHVRSYLDMLLDKSDVVMADRVRELVIILLPQRRCTAQQVAVRLGINRRTLDRRLAESGTTFLSIVTRAREELALRYLAEGSRTMSEISALLGFASVSAFSRWFKNHHRQPPKRFRGTRRNAPTSSRRTGTSRSG